MVCKELQLTVTVVLNQDTHKFHAHSFNDGFIDHTHTSIQTVQLHRASVHVCQQRVVDTLQLLSAKHVCVDACAGSSLTCAHASMGLLSSGVPVSRKARLAPRTRLPTKWDLQGQQQQGIMMVKVAWQHTKEPTCIPACLQLFSWGQGARRWPGQPHNPAHGGQVACPSCCFVTLTGLLLGS
jgi:hypothetical protein